MCVVQNAREVQNMHAAYKTCKAAVRPSHATQAGASRNPSDPLCIWLWSGMRLLHAQELVTVTKVCSLGCTTPYRGCTCSLRSLSIDQESSFLLDRTLLTRGLHESHPPCRVTRTPHRHSLPCFSSSNGYDHWSVSPELLDTHSNSPKWELIHMIRL